MYNVFKIMASTPFTSLQKVTMVVPIQHGLGKKGFVKYVTGDGQNAGLSFKLGNTHEMDQWFWLEAECEVLDKKNSLGTVNLDQHIREPLWIKMVVPCPVVTVNRRVRLCGHHQEDGFGVGYRRYHQFHRWTSPPAVCCCWRRKKTRIPTRQYFQVGAGSVAKCSLYITINLPSLDPAVDGCDAGVGTASYGASRHSTFPHAHQANAVRVRCLNIQSLHLPGREIPYWCC